MLKVATISLKLRKSELIVSRHVSCEIMSMQGMRVYSAWSLTCSKAFSKYKYLTRMSSSKIAGVSIPLKSYFNNSRMNSFQYLS